jgi:hypothetical protein
MQEISEQYFCSEKEMLGGESRAFNGQRLCPKSRATHIFQLEIFRGCPLTASLPLFNAFRLWFALLRSFSSRLSSTAVHFGRDYRLWESFSTAIGDVEINFSGNYKRYHSIIRFQ